jgi:hypothetical protein
MLGYDAEYLEDRVVLVFYWQATRLMERDYSMSTRLLDPDSETVVWAHDAAPRDWSYPTSWWDLDEVVSDTVTCDLSALSAGQYQLAVVVYDPRSGETLTTSISYRGKQSDSIPYRGKQSDYNHQSTTGNP